MNNDLGFDRKRILAILWCLQIHAALVDKISAPQFNAWLCYSDWLRTFFTETQTPAWFSGSKLYSVPNLEKRSLTILLYVAPFQNQDYTGVKNRRQISFRTFHHVKIRGPSDGRAKYLSAFSSSAQDKPLVHFWREVTACAGRLRV